MLFIEICLYNHDVFVVVIIDSDSDIESVNLNSSCESLEVKSESELDKSRERDTTGQNWNYTMDKNSLDKKTMPTLTQVNIFTDGSKTMNHVGAGYVIYIEAKEEITGSIKLSENATLL